MPTSRVGMEFIPLPTVRFTGSEFLYRDDSYPFMYGALAVEGVPRGHIDYLPLEVFFNKFLFFIYFFLKRLPKLILDNGIELMLHH